MKKLLFGLLVFALFLSVGYAQQNVGEIIGTVLLADGSVLPGVNVTLTGDVTGKMTTVSSERGYYRFLKLAPGNYNLVFELDGFKTVDRSQLRVSVGGSLTLNVVMEPGAVQEKVLVVGQAPMISTRQATVSTTVTRDDMDSLPLGRGYFTAINMTPGVLSEAQGGGITGGSELFYGPGTSAEKNEWSIDGASTAGRNYPGEIGAVISKNQLEETQVSVSSHDIMNISGGVSVNFVSKRGGNRISGNMFIELMDKKFERNQTLPADMASRKWVPAGVERIWDYAASLGGPIWKDHLWYFGSASTADPITRSYTGATTRPTYSGNYYFKINAQYKHTTAQFSYDWSNTATTNIPISNFSPAQYKSISPGSFYAAEIQHVMGNLLVTAKSTFSKTSQSTHDNAGTWTGTGNTYAEGRRIDFPFRAWTYNYAEAAPKSALPPISMYIARDELGRRPYFVAYADYFAEKFLGGDHEFKLGIDFANNKFNQELLRPNHLTLYVNQADDNFTWPDGTMPGVSKIFAYQDDTIGMRYSKRQSVFFQDTATYKKLTVNLGLRWDRNSWGWGDFMLGAFNPFNAGASNGPWEPWIGELKIAADTVPVHPTAISPRISVTYDLTGDGKNVIKASWAQYNGILSNRPSQTIAPGAGRAFVGPYFDFNGNNWPDEGEFQRFTPGEIERIQNENDQSVPGYAYYGFSGISPLGPPKGEKSTNVYDPDWKTPGVQEFVVGYEKQLTQDISVGVNGYHKKETNDLLQLDYEGTPDNYKPRWPWEITYTQIGTEPTTGNAIYTSTTPPYTLPGEGGTFFTHDRYNWTNYWGAEFQFHKRLSHNWMFNFSFNYQDYKKHLDQREWDPTLYHYFSKGVADPSSYRSSMIFYNARWMIKANGLYKFPMGFSLSGTLIANEGNPVYNAVTEFDGVTYYPMNEKYGDLRLPSVVQVNLGLEKEFVLSERTSLTLAALYYNVFNSTTIIRVGQEMVPQIMRPDMVMAPGIMQLCVRLNWR